MIKILFVCNFESPYRIIFWNELTKYCDVTVLFSETTKQQKDRNSKWFNGDLYKFHYHILKQTPIICNKHICFGITSYLKQSYDIIIFHPYSPLTCIYGILYCINHKTPYVINSDGGFKKTGRGLKEKFKKYIISHAEAYLSSGTNTNKYLNFYGARDNHIYDYCFTSLKKNEILSEPVTKNKKINLRNQLGIIEENVIISVGQFIPRKGFDMLLNAANNMSRNIGFYIIGGRPTDEILLLRKKYQLEKNVYFLDFMEKNYLKNYYMAGDLFVLPTKEDIWGLVINEAMANGLPIITTNKCIAGLELISNGLNGYIVDSQDSKMLQKKISMVLDNEELKLKLAIGSINSIKEYTIENMAEKHKDIFEKIIQNANK